MALTEQQEKDLLQMHAAFTEGIRINELETAIGPVDGMTIEVQDESGESKKINLKQAITTANTPMGGRYWNETLATPTAAGYYGSLDFLRNLPSILGLGCYLVQDDRTRRKLDPADHYRFADGSPAALDGSMGQYMWCWNAHYYAWWKEGDNYYEVVSLTPLENVECYYIPAGGTSALGAGVVDRQEEKLCSLISDDPRYRGGNNSPDFMDDAYKSLCGKPATNIPLNTFSDYARKRGEGWEANWYISRAVQEYLFRIIMGTRNSQAPYNPEKDPNGLYQGGLGDGVTTLSTAEWSDWSESSDIPQPLISTSIGIPLGDNVGVINYNLLNRDGSVFKTVQVPVFFGLKNMYGHLYLGIRGLINDIQESDSYVHVCPSMYAGQSNTSIAGMIKAAQLPSGMAEGYITKMSMKNLCNAPTQIGGSSTTYYCDYFWQNNGSGLRSRLTGACAYSGAQAGIGAYYAHSPINAITAVISSPLCYFEEDPLMK